MEGRFGWRRDLRTHVASGHRIGLAVVEAPLGEGFHVPLVEGAEAVIVERQRRAQLTGTEGRERPPPGLDDALHALEAGSKRKRVAKGDALDLKPGLGSHASRILEHRRDEAIAAR